MAREVVHGQFDAEFFVFVFEFVKFPGAFGLFFQFFQLVFNLEKQVFHAVEVGGCGFEFLLRFVFAGFVFAHACGLFKHFPAGLLAVAEHVFHHVQGNDGVRIGADTGIQKKRSNVFQAAGDAIEAVFAVAAAVQDTADTDGAVIRREYVFGIVEGQRHLGHLAFLALFGAVEYDRRHFVQAQLTAFLFAQHPADGIHNVRFAGAIGAHHTRHIGVEVQNGFVGEGLETFYFQGF